MEFVLEGPEARHAVAVKRLAAGEAVDIVDGAGTRMSGTVAEAAGTRLTVRCGALVESSTMVNHRLQPEQR